MNAELSRELQRLWQPLPELQMQAIRPAFDALNLPEPKESDLAIAQMLAKTIEEQPTTPN